MPLDRTPLTPEEHFSVIVDRHPESTCHSAEDETLTEAVDQLLVALLAAASAVESHVYAGAFNEVFRRLDGFDETLSAQRFLRGGSGPSRADWWLYCVLVRFDAVYYGLYKCNRRRVVDYAHLGGYLRDVHQLGGLEDTVDFEAIKAHYYRASETLNPRLIVPRGEPDLWLPHDRLARFDREALRALGTEESGSTRRGGGEWVRKRSGHRNWITADGASGYAAEPGRYHLYIANNCPWCHRVALARNIKRLQNVVSLDVLFYRRDPDRGWQFRPDEPGCTPDSIFGHQFLRELYEMVGSEESSAPVLLDKHTKTIVSNESSEIIRMLNDAFVEQTDAVDLYPPELRAEIDQLNGWIYTDVNNGAYKAGFARSQEAYDKAYVRLFTAFERIDGILANRRFLTGSTLTEADVRLFPTIFRFDHIYYTRFRLNHRLVREYRHLHRWLRDTYQQEGVAAASNLRHARNGYFGRTGNNLVPLGPDADFEPAPSATELAMLAPPATV